MHFTSRLLRWYEENRRAMPWRGENDPYKIWVSEIILQQTRVNQGWDYYNRFIEMFPDITTLAEAPVEKVLKLWQGLGYYSRARNMHEAAKTMQTHYDGKFPEKYENIRRLKGIGEYTAAAIASIAFNLPYPAVDGNVFRVICRFYGIFDDIQLACTKKEITKKCTALMKGCAPDEFNQAIMDFGALQCTPKNPKCDTCPFHDDCFAYKTGKIAELPTKTKKGEVKNRYFHYFFFTNNENTILRQRDENDIWKGLFEFPMMETTGLEAKEVHELLQHYNHPQEPTWKIKHQLTHQTIYASFYCIHVKKLPTLKNNEKVVDNTQLHNYPFPKIMAEFLERMKNI